MGLANVRDMLSTALRNHKHEGNQLPGGRSRRRGRAVEAPAPHLKAVAPDPEAAEAAEGGLGDVAGLPIGRIPDSDADDGAAGAGAPDAAPVV